MTVAIYTLPEMRREVHMMGSYVGVCLRIEQEKKVIMQDGIKYLGETWVRNDSIPPYIDFLDIRQDKDGVAYKDDDSPVRGGLSVNNAIQIAQELAEAIHYIQSKGWESN